MVKVSIIVPVYNAEQYLSKCLDSLVSQNIENIEIVCINDGSTDMSMDILYEFSCKYPNVVIFNNDGNKGLSFSRNYGIKMAKGEYLLFVDADDWLIDENVVSFLYNKAKEERLDLLRYSISTDTQVVDQEYNEDGKTLFSVLISNNIYKWESVRNFVKKEFLYDKNIFFDEEIYGCEDVLFSTKCIWNVERVIEIPNIFYHYNRHEGSITKSNITSRNVEGFLRVINSLYDIFGKNIYDDYRYYLIKLINQLNQMCESVLFRLDSNLDCSKWTNDIISVYENLFKEGKLIHNYIVHNNWDKLLYTNSLYLYGAGKACEEMLNKTCFKLNYSGIIVTKKEMNQNEFKGLPIYEVIDENIDKTGLVIICITGKERQLDVKKELFLNGFKNVLCVAKE